MFNLLHRFGDPLFVPDERKNKEYAEWLRESGYQPPGEPEYQELLRLLEEEIASVREEFAYAEKANEERVAIEREACLAPEGETWSMLLRQEAALDRSIDRKVRILLRLRKDFTDLPPSPMDQSDDAGMEDINRILGMDIPSRAPATEGAQCGVPVDKLEATRAHHPVAPSSERRGVAGLAPLLGKEG
jgi:hypothetical protein